MRRRVGYLVGEHCGQPSFVLRDAQYSGVHSHFTAWQAEGIGLAVIEQCKFPLGPLQWRHSRNTSAHPLHHGGSLLVFAEGLLGFDTVESLPAHGSFPFA